LPPGQPGFYRVWAVYSDGKTHLQSQPVEFQATADVTGLQLTLEAGSEITGSVEVPGDRPGVPREKRTIRIGESSAEPAPTARSTLPPSIPANTASKLIRCPKTDASSR
jgi:hypothetical protein